MSSSWYVATWTWAARAAPCVGLAEPGPVSSSPRAVSARTPQRRTHSLMPDLRFKSQPPAHTEIPRTKKGEGQWALGYTEPLNKNEQSKKDDDPLNVQARILHIYSK